MAEAVAPPAAPGSREAARAWVSSWCGDGTHGAITGRGVHSAMARLEKEFRGSEALISMGCKQ